MDAGMPSHDIGRRPGMGSRPVSNEPGSSYDGYQAQLGHGRSYSHAYGRRTPAGPIVPTEVFTTMRYNLQPIMNAEPSGALTQTEADALVDAMLPAEIFRRRRKAARVPSTNPFAAAMMEAAAAQDQDGPSEISAAAPLDAEVAAYRLARHIPLLAEHLERLQVSAGAMCRIYPLAWSAALLQQRRVLQGEQIMLAVEEAIFGSDIDNDSGAQVRGIRVAIKREGRIEVRIRDLIPFPDTASGGGSEVSAAAAAGRSLGSSGWAVRPPPPSVRIDTMPTRVRMLDLEPVAFNKTDARGFYEAAKARVSADPSVLSGVRPEDGRCFDVLLWTDEQLDLDLNLAAHGIDASDTAAAADEAQQQVTESSIANIVVEMLHPLPSLAGQKDDDDDDDDLYYNENDDSDGRASWRSLFITPPSQLGMLDGLLRHHLVESKLVEESVVTVSQLRAWLERGEAKLWLCNSLRGMWQVELVDDLPFQLPRADATGQQRREVTVGGSAGETQRTTSGGVATRRGGGAGKKRFSTLMRRSSVAASPAATNGAGAADDGRQAEGRKGKKGAKEEKCLVM